MITLITGTPGAGKSLRALWWLVTHYMKVDKQDGLRRPVYTNVDGITLDVEPLPDDWRDTPEGSVIVIDEAQKYWPSTGRPGVSQREDIRALETHRHTGHDIILVTQHPTLIDAHVRKLVGRHEHLRRALGGANASHVYSRNEVFDVQDKSQLSNCDHQVWQFDKSLYSKYQSATLHTVKWYFPKKLRRYLIVIAICVGILFLLFRQTIGVGGMFSSGFGSLNLASSDVVDTGLSVVTTVVTDIPVRVYRGCIWDDETCYCYAENYSIVEQSDSECRRVVSKPIPTSVDPKS
jgi:Zonula occludens toxin